MSEWYKRAHETVQKKVICEMEFGQIAQIEDEAILTYELIQRGLLARSRKCKNRRKHEYDVDMQLSFNHKRWRCSDCSNNYSVKTKSFFEQSNVDLLSWIKVIDLWSQEEKVKDIANNVPPSRTTVIEMIKGLREQCQAFLETNPPAIGGPGRHLRIDILKVCERDLCDILIIKEQGRERGYLLHNTGGRYNNPEGRILPVLPGSTVFSTEQYNLPANVAFSGDVALYQGDAEPERHAKEWIRKKYGIQCSKVGGYLGEYNFRFFQPQPVHFGERFIVSLGRHYEGEFLQ
ncbi:uncharacterized protein [Clytia hemisphaerica]|uniref:uncharacterized protein n=1 Tax=Clytia hemisphaerica TaxID=252671 RepID=UPI0034D4B8DB